MFTLEIPVLATFQKKVAEKQDYDIFFTNYLNQFSDTYQSHTAILETGLTLDLIVVLLSPTPGLKIWVSGGTSGKKYKLTVTLLTTGGRTKQEIIYFEIL